LEKKRDKNMTLSFAKVLVAALAAGSVTALPTMDKPATPSNPPAAPVDNTALLQELELAPTSLQKFQKLFTVDGKGQTILPKEELAKKIVFDFNQKPGENKTGDGGFVKKAEVDKFPVLTGLGISVTVADLGPCGMNTPHVHPRATEFLTVVDGSINFGMIPENGLVKTGSAEVSGTLTKKQGTVFPQGSIHYQFNDNCEPATFVAALNSEDPGTSQVAQNFFGLNSTVVQVALRFPASLEGSKFDEFKKSIPANLAQDMTECLKRCPKPGY
jgi:hypothetical protein